MKIIFITTVLGVFLPVILLGQGFDANWLAGTNEYPHAGRYGNAVATFQDDTVVVEQIDLKMNFESTLGVISDSLGNLLFFTNGCYVADASGDTMSNGDGLNPGLVHDWVCPENGYISPRGAMILPMPGSTHQYYLLHMGVRYESGKNLSFGPFYYSVVDMALNDGKGAVTSKNQVLADGSLEPFAVTRHGNGRDWWIIVPEDQSMRYRRFVAGPGAIHEAPALEIGDTGNCLRIGSAAFSPDGRRFARRQNCKTLVFDFDRCSGALTNPIALTRPEKAFGGGGVAFSPDGNMLFATDQMAILSANLMLPAPLFDTLINTEAITGAGLHFMQYGPDGKRIYMNILHRSRIFSSLDSLHLLQPVFTQAALSLPVYSVRTLPHFPHFRLYDLPDSPCDTLGINTPVSVADNEKPAAGYHLYPNPTATSFTLRTTSSFFTGGEPVVLYNSTGQVLATRQPARGETSLVFGVESYPPGVYWLRVEGVVMKVLRMAGF
ncbi:MAG: T9SS type A sorting domain-containing protein [Saprospiraceae bacterium]|nr:T9SS type A sorting domain-containing protein [Saprospiraceae bacterium]